MKHIITQLIYYATPWLYKWLLFRKYDNLNWSSLLKSNAENEILLLKHFLSEGSVFFDIGSNIGAYLYIAKKYTEPNNIYGFEPIPELYHKLLTIFRTVNISNVALSNENAIKDFKIPIIEGTAFSARGTLNTDYIEDGENNSKEFTVTTRKMDQFISENNIPNVDLVKIDVEGHEIKVIEGGLESIKKFKPSLIIEIEQRHHNTNLNEIIDWIKGLGYKCFYFDVNKFRMRELNINAADIQRKEHHTKSRKYVNNFIFIANEKDPLETIRNINNEIMIPCAHEGSLAS